MPLVSCPVCEKQISKRAHTCPGCGEPDPLHHLAKSKFISMVFWTLVPDILLGSICYQC